MDILFADINRKNTSFLPDDGYIDCEIGSDSTHETAIPISSYDNEIHVNGGFIYSVGTEIGGRINRMKVSTADKTVTFTGDCYRNLLNHRYVVPPSGEDYLYVSGELNAVIRILCQNALHGGLFTISDKDTGINVGRTKISRYASCDEACDQVLSKVNHKLSLKAVEYEFNDSVHFRMELEAVPAHDFSDQIEISEDGQVDFVIETDEKNPYTHMICLGPGKLRNRMVVYLKLNDDGSVEEVYSLPDALGTKVYKYDNVNVESREELIESAVDQWRSLIITGGTSITLSNGIDAWIGDIVAGREYITGTYIREKITQVIYKYTDGIETLSYKVGKEQT